MKVISKTRRGLKWKEQLLALYFGMTDPATPFWAKIPAIISILYLISPIDLLPDFIPLAGWIDDLIIVPLLLSLSVKMLPMQVRERSRTRAKMERGRLNVFLILILIILVLVLIGSIYLIKKALYTLASPASFA